MASQVSSTCSDELSPEGETVLGCFVKAGYEIHYYDFDKNLSPVFEEEMIPQISVLLVCGYYGYPTYDENFVKKM